MSDENVAAVELALECLNKGDLDGYVSLFHEDAGIFGYPADVPANVAGVRAYYAMLRAGAPDLTLDPIDLFSAGMRVVLRYNVTGTHRVEMMERQPTGHAIAFEGLTILYFQDGKVAHQVVRADDMALLTQIGVIATPSSTSG